MSEQPTPTPDPGSGSKRARYLKGCGCLGGLLVMALGILIIGNFDETAWASALIGTIVGILVFSMSGVNGTWEE
ncbi:MAG: hypothetical protein ABW321_01245 [Polyangiales bacterium]